MEVILVPSSNSFLIYVFQWLKNSFLALLIQKQHKKKVLEQEKAT